MSVQINEKCTISKVTEYRTDAYIFQSLVTLALISHHGTSIRMVTSASVSVGMFRICRA